MRWLIVVVALLWSCGSSSTSTAGVPVSGQLPEQQLATIQKQAPVTASDPLIRQFHDLLDDLQRRCSDPRERLADYTVASQKEMAKRGVNKDLLSIMSEIDFRISKVSEAVAKDLGPTQMACSDQFALYVVQTSVPP